MVTDDRWTNFSSRGSFRNVSWADAIDPADRAGYAYAWWENDTVRMEHIDSLGRAATWLLLTNPEADGDFIDLETRVRISPASGDDPFARIGGTYFRVEDGDIFATVGIRHHPGPGRIQDAVPLPGLAALLSFSIA